VLKRLADLLSHSIGLFDNSNCFTDDMHEWIEMLSLSVGIINRKIKVLAKEANALMIHNTSSFSIVYDWLLLAIGTKRFPKHFL
jgi:hypothetical protein